MTNEKRAKLSLLSSFQDVSFRSFRTFCRSLDATRKCFQHLSHRHKGADDMSFLSDADVIEFYTKDKLLEERKTSLHGEVPDCFRTKNFCVSIEGQNWVHKRDLKDSYTWARVYLRNKDSETFHEVMRTEIVAGDRHPRFTARARFSPLAMQDSQNHAMTTTIRVDAYSKETQFASIHVNLAPLLWNMSYETGIESLRPSILAPQSGNRSKVKLNVLKDRSVDDDDDDDDFEVLFNIQMTRSVWRNARESKLFMSVSSVAGYGQWSRCYVSELLFAPTKSIGTGRFSLFKLNRDDLMGCNPQNPVRIEILGTKRGISTVHGFIQLGVPSASRKCYVSWNQSTTSYLSANVVLQATVTRTNRVSMSFSIGTDDDAAEIYTAIQGHEVTAGQDGKYRRKWNAFLSQITQSDGSLGSSSGSSDLSAASSAQQEGINALSSGPQYHVRFPT